MRQNQLIKGVECFDVQRVGGKAVSLGRLTAAGFPIPAFVVVPANNDLDRDTIHESCQVLMSNGRFLAVRSSSTDEDGMNASFAGLLESFLNVTIDEVIDRIDQVRQSVFAPRHSN